LSPFYRGEVKAVTQVFSSPRGLHLLGLYHLILRHLGIPFEGLGAGGSGAAGTIGTSGNGGGWWCRWLLWQDDLFYPAL